MSIILGICTAALIVTSLFLILVVLAQKAKSDGGMGAAMGGGTAEATFGADTGNVLSKATHYAAVIFFILSISLYLGRIYELKHAGNTGGMLPTIAVPAKARPLPAGLTAPAAPAIAPAAVPTPSPAAKP